jgi:endonuclease G, mitochondrial
MRFRLLRALFVCAAIAGLLIHRADSVRAVSTTVVISQVYGGGGNSGAPFNSDFVELYNAGSVAINLAGWSIQYGSSSGTTWLNRTNLTGTIQPGSYFLVQESGGATGAPLPTPDLPGGTINMSATAGKVALVNSTTALSGACPASASIVDFVGYGSGVNCSEGAPAPAPSNSTSIIRVGADTDANNTNFVVSNPPNPRNQGDSAPSVLSTSPSNTAIDVPLNANVTINFSEPVNTDSSAFSVVCGHSGVHPFTASGTLNITSVTLNPDTDFDFFEVCTVSVAGLGVSDVDSSDPPDTMLQNYSFAFTTVPQTDNAPSVLSATPANGATNVPVTTPIVIGFSESVTASASAFSIQCPAGSPQVFTQSASPATSITLTPSAPLPYATLCTVTVTKEQISDTDVNDPPDQMADNVGFSFTTENAPPPGAGKVLINEIDADTPGSDTAEFIELYDGGLGNTPLDGLVLVLFDGQTGSGNLSYAKFDLDGYSTDTNGYFILGNPGVPGASIIFDPGQFGLLQNGPDAVALYIGHDTDFPNGTPATTTKLLDAAVYGTDDPSASGLLPLLNTGQPIVNENATGASQTQSSQRCANGSGGFRNTASYYPGTPTPGGTNSCPPPRPPSDVVISQVYGGGGNASAAYHNDFVELHNRGAAAVDLTGWSLQYASATGGGWEFTMQPLGGSIGAGEYYLIALASGGANGAALPAANIVGDINMAAASGKVALVKTFDGLVGNCPIFDPEIADLVGYGTVDCSEGSKAAPSGNSAGTNVTALFRKNGGATDTDVNGNDFTAATPPDPRRTAPIVELGPLVLRTDPRRNGVNAPRDATIQVTFTEPVDVDPSWFDIVCAATGHHTDATFAGGGKDHYITPNVNFQAGEQCTLTVFTGRIHDQDTDDSGADTDTLPANYVGSFTVATGTAPPYPPSVHLAMGNPSGATADTGAPANYLMEKPEYALSYNRDLGRPNWGSWHLSDDWVGTLARVDTFRPDPEVPPDWYRVQAFDFSGSGFDRGHMTPNADRDKETSIPINQATFLMSNIVAQAPGNNQGPWAAFETYLRTLVDVDHDELYIVAGPAGMGGIGSLGGVTNTIAGGHVRVPAATWKVALVLPKDDGNDLARITCTTRTIAVIMPNDDGIRPNPWETYLTNVDAVETLTGYDLFSNVPPPLQQCIEAGINGDNPPLVKGDQTIAFAPLADKEFGDADFPVSATSSSGLPVSFAVVSGPAAMTGNTVHLTGVGTVTIRASQGGSDIYNAAPDVDRMFDVSKAASALSALSSPSIEVGTASTILGGVIGANGLVPPGSVTITVAGVSASAPIAANGQFSASLPTATLTAAGSPYAITYSYAGDVNFTSAGGIGTLTVADSIPPTVGVVSATPSTLGAPNHKMIDVFLAFTASDASGAPVCAVAVSSNEPANGTGDGDTDPDWIVIDAHHVQLRAERAAGGSGRIYTLTVTCTDASGHSSSSATTVAVPK